MFAIGVSISQLTPNSLYACTDTDYNSAIEEEKPNDKINCKICFSSVL